MNSKWSHLPNAKYIDAILADVKANQNAWVDAWGEALNAAWGATLNAARDAAWAATLNAARDPAGNAAWSAARDAAWDPAWSTARNAAWSAARDAAWEPARGAVWDSVVALIAWDHSAKYLSMTPDEIRVWYALTNDPACILLLPASYTKTNNLRKTKCGVE